MKYIVDILKVEEYSDGTNTQEIISSTIREFEDALEAIAWGECQTGGLHGLDYKVRDIKTQPADGE